MTVEGAGGWERYAWLDHAGDVPDAFCLAVAVGTSADEAIEAFAADPASLRQLTLAEQMRLAEPYPAGGGDDTVAVEVLDGAAVCMQRNGWACLHVPRVERLSRTGPYAGFYCSVNADMTFVYARDGALVRDFDPLLYDRDPPDEPLDEERGLPFGMDNPVAASFCLLERLTGVVITREWLLSHPHPTYRRDARVDVEP